MTMEKVFAHLDALESRYPQLSVCRGDIISAFEILKNCFEKGGKVLIGGNGGSCADAQHIVGELMKGFKLPRKCTADFAAKLLAADEHRGAALAEKLQRALPAVALSEQQALNTAYMNDVKGGAEYAFAQQLFGLGNAGDVFWGISTSGNSANVLNAAVAAKAIGMKIIGLTGAKGGELAAAADVAIKVPASETYEIQEYHLPVYHCICLMLEEHFFGKPIG